MADGPRENTGVGLTPDTMRRLDRLRAVLGKSRSQVIELALTEGGLSDLEDVHDAEIKRFTRLANADNVTWQDYAAWYAASFSGRTYPPDITELEQLAQVSDAPAPVE